VASCLLFLAPLIAAAAPFPTRDQNPLLAGYGLPMPMPARIVPPGQWRAAADLNWGSSAIAQSDRGEALIVDAETRELRVTLERGFADRWALQLQLPWRYTGGGNLDGFIDNWHEVFGLPDGARRDFPRDRLRIAYARDNAVRYDRQSSMEGIADVSAAVGYQWIFDADSAVAAWLTVKLPVGDADKLTGSGATDAALVVAGEQRFGNRWFAFGQLGLTYLGNGDLLADRQRDVVWSGLAGAGVHLWRGLELKLQFDAHDAVFDSAVDFLGDAAIFTVGGGYQFESGWKLDIGVSEDIVVDRSPDVVLVLGVRKALGRRPADQPSSASAQSPRIPF
jgi:hypothetical protein